MWIRLYGMNLEKYGYENFTYNLHTIMTAQLLCLCS